MNQDVRLKSVFISLVITATIAMVGASLIGNGISWFNKLEKPDYLISIQLFMIMGILYNLMFAYILYRLLVIYFQGKYKHALHAVEMVVLVMVTNEGWNYFFMGMESTRNGFFGMMLFLAILFFSLWKVKPIDKISSILLLLYSVWLIYAIIWSYALWKMN